MIQPFSDAESDLLPLQTTGTVLIVDDEPMVTTSISTMLNLESDYEAIAFNSPLAALVYLETSVQPDVVISDFLMPEMDGLTFLQAVRERFPQCSLMLLTGYTEKANAIQAINDVGIYRYIEKPWDNDALKLAIKNGIERTRLLASLNEKITDLETARQDLQAYSNHLESRVTEKTQDLTEALNKLQAIVENTGDGIVTLDSAGHIVGFNPTFVQWTQQSAAQIEGQPLSHFLTFGDGLSLTQLLALEAPSSLREARLGLIPLEINVSPLPRNQGLVLVCRDIAKRKEAERLREDFVSTLTHDLRTPLLAAIQTLGLFLDNSVGPLTEQQASLLTMLVGSNQQMLALVNVLLEVYRYEAHQQTLIFEHFSAADLVNSVIQELSALALKKNQHLENQIPAGSLAVFADKQAIRRVLTNLIGNALHYTPHDGRIVITGHQTAQQIVLTVTDNGRGIPQHDLTHLFERFAQGTSKHRTTGTGLGLYLSRQILEAHGGAISAESSEGQGSAFSITLPNVN